MANSHFSHWGACTCDVHKWYINLFPAFLTPFPAPEDVTSARSLVAEPRVDGAYVVRQLLLGGIGRDELADVAPQLVDPPDVHLEVGALEGGELAPVALEEAHPDQSIGHNNIFWLVREKYVVYVQQQQLKCISL